jgi:hypothetical protein
MQISQDLQSALLNAIKQHIEQETSLADELADCLSVSKDSAYRRIRGETLFDISDIEKLTKKYNLSLDSFFGLKKSTVPFSMQSINFVDFTFVDYFNDMVKKLSIIDSMEQKHLYYSARDVPIFHYFQIPELGAFKLYFWLKYYLSHPALHDLKFNSEEVPNLLKRFKKAPEKAWHLYLKVPSTEIWTYETPNITLRQIEFAYQSGILNMATAAMLMDQFKGLIEHISKQAEQGNKFYINSEATLEGAEYNIYFNEVAIGDNSLLFKMGEQKMAFNTYGNINYMSTTDKAYTDYIDGHFKSTMRNSTLISGTAEKIRRNFFASLVRKIESVESKLSEHSMMY